MREVDELSPERLAGQLLVVGFDGTELPPELLRTLRDGALGGIILFQRNLPDVETAWRLCRAIAAGAPAELPPFVAVDQEGGRVARLREGVIQLPPMRRLGELDDVEFTQQLAAQLAHELSAIGFNLDFAPVADVDTNPNNPVIGDRSFGSDPARVTRHCGAFIDGLQEHGVMACIKHFPGHGDTDQDSHFDLPRVDRSTVNLRRVELYPFERLARKSAAVMTAHVVFSSLDALPATLSPRLCTTLLRREFDFEGVLFSDDLEMGALSRHWPIETSSVLAVEAGCDALLVCKDADQIARARTALTERITNDVSFRDRCRQAVVTSLTARRSYPPRPVQRAAELHEILGSRAGRTSRERLRQLR